MAILIALVLTISIGASMVLMPNASAHSPPWNITDAAFLQAAPNPIGVGQTLVVTFWTAQPVPNALITNNIRKGNYTLAVTLPDGTTATLWTPSEIVSNTGGEQTITYIPTETGQYQFNFLFGGMTYPTLAQVTSTVPLTAATNASINALAGDIYEPETASLNVTVQQQPLTQTFYPLPTAYWTRPIEGENIYWYTVASNWLGPSSGQLGTDNVGGFNNYQTSGTAPTSGHIMWTMPIEFGGVVGGTNTAVPGATYYSGSSYEPRFYNALILNGNLYFKMPIGDYGTMTAVNGVYYGGDFVDISLATGKVVWANASPTYDPTWGQLFNCVNPNQSGVTGGYLYQSWTVAGAVSNAAGSTVTPANVTWIAYDAFTGDWMFNITNIPQSQTVYQTSSNGILSGSMLSEVTSAAGMGPSGELLKLFLGYNTATQTGWIAQWNTTDILENPLIEMSEYRPVGTIVNGGTSGAYDWNMTISGGALDGLAVNATAPNGVSLTGPTINTYIPGDILVGTSSGLSQGVGPQYTPNPFTMWAINLNATVGPVGKVLWVQNYTAPNLMNGNSYLGSYTQRFGQVDPVNNVITMQIGETMEWMGYSLTTGNYMWGPTTTAFPDGYQYFGSGLGIGQCATTAYGNIYVQGYGGTIQCYNTATGVLTWIWGNGGEGNSTNDGINSPWGLLPTMITDVCNGMVYGYTTQHGNGAQSPYYVNEFEFCLNATTGQQIWAMNGQSPNDGGGGYPQNIIADGQMLYYNMYDNQIYDIGQGPSSTTVTAPDVGVTTATPITITGTVTDVSPGTQQTEQKADFPNGVPCVSDASQSQWMEYVYMQKPEPTNVTGVPVTISVVDSNGNSRVIGTTTTDASGTYSLGWTPDITGAYTVIASFAGSNSYWGSSAEAHFDAAAAPATPAPSATPVSGLASTSTVELGIAAVIIVIIIIGAVLALLLLRKRP